MELYIRNLTSKHTTADIQTLFGKYCITALKVVTNKNKASIGFGFVQIADDANGEKAIKDLNGKRYNRRIIFVSPAHASHYNHYMDVKIETSQINKQSIAKPTNNRKKKT